MTTGPSEDTGVLPLEVADRINRVCDRFEQAWRAGEGPTIEAFLGEEREPVRSALLGELLADEVERRLRQGERPVVGDYLPRFPEHAALILGIIEGRELPSEARAAPA